jgi:cytochrome c oxidase cbb3-type subunit 2
MPNPSAVPKDEWREEFDPPPRTFAAATAAVAAVYTYFLVFAQFGFLHALAAGGIELSWLRPILALMAAAGIGAGFLAARAYTEKRALNLLRAGFTAAAGAAGLTWVARAPFHFLLAALLTGAGLGLATVALAALLRREIGGTRLGRCIGLGTGVAYAVSNQPEIFSGAHAIQALAGIVAAGLGLLASQAFAQQAPRQQTSGRDYDRAGVGLWVTVFLVLVGFDSAVFFLVQHQPALQPAWPSGSGLYVNAGIHLAAATLAGLALDRRWIASTVATAAALLVGASLWFATGRGGPVAAHLYSAGVSIYSVALVFYPARRAQPGLAALLYAVAGWAGSALGIGLAQGLDRLPVALPLAAGAAIAGLLAARAWRQ